MSNFNIEVRDHRLYSKSGEVYLACTPFTPPDSLKEFRRTLRTFEFILEKKVTEGAGFTLLNGFRLRRPAMLEISRKNNGKQALLSVQTGGYNSAGELLEDLVDRLGLITDFVGPSLSNHMRVQVGESLAEQNQVSRFVSNYSTVTFEDSFGALGYAAFLRISSKIDYSESFKRAGKEYGFNLLKAIDAMKRQDRK